MMDINRNYPTHIDSSNHSPRHSESNLPSTTTTPTTIIDHRRPDRTIETRARKKSHGNKKLQRFRKRRRARGMSEAAINKTIEARKREKEKQEATKQQSQQRRTSTTKITDAIPVSFLEWQQHTKFFCVYHTETTRTRKS